MSRPGRLVPLVAALAVAAAALPAPAYATDCAFPADCWNTIAAAALAAAGLAALAALLPGLGISAGVAALAGAAGVLAGSGEGGTGVLPGFGVDPGVAQQVAGDPGLLQSWADAANPTGSNTNCWNVAQSIAQDLATGQFAAAPNGTGTSIDNIVSSTGGSLDNPAGFGEIDQQMANAPPGSQGLVIVADPDTGHMHVFNAVNVNGQTYYIDGQSHSATSSSQAMAAADHYVGPDIQSAFVRLWR